MSYITSVGLQFLSDSLYFLTDILPKLAVATVCGAIVGYDRERKHKTAGTRTMVLICTGCTLYTMIPFLLMAETSMMDIPIDIDPTRVIGQILTGIGFLGAGVIMKDSNKIIGVTTAAFIWVVAAIGVLIGVSDRPFLPIIMTLSLVSVTNLFRKIEKNIKQKEDNAEIGD
jgi:putative Mg2+ transporter-C (MgtC) family protein